MRSKADETFVIVETLHHSCAIKKAICCGVMSMYCDAAPGSTLKKDIFCV